MSDKPTLLAGGNPRIAKGEGDAPVQAWIAGLQGWKGEAARRLDALVEATVPGLRKAVKWNSPFYGVTGEQGWFLSVHAYDRYLKLAFFRGVRLDPPPPVGSTRAEVRYAHVGEDGFDAAQMADWLAQAARLPGMRL